MKQRKYPMTNRTPSYQFTTTDLSDSKIALLKGKAKLLGLEEKAQEIVAEAMGEPKLESKRFRVVIRPRLGKNSPYASLYARGGELYRYSSQDIRPEHGERFDVYLHVVMTATKYSKYYRAR